MVNTLLAYVRNATGGVITPDKNAFRNYIAINIEHFKGLFQDKAIDYLTALWHEYMSESDKLLYTIKNLGPKITNGEEQKLRFDSSPKRKPKRAHKKRVVSKTNFKANRLINNIILNTDRALIN